ncbi:adenylate/guanylate cyclase domain-containing protein [Rhizobium sp. FY34]|uniref:adenylate/guanylate cyclase domain-containing protein n=1 Tax=Rhizobium sp. FY34 TaxID=2562309 RepID=UPI0010C138AB|nr:adenylate/guanylate cyclase domain-containing protein [Rhizobium sp. FY34]
MTTSQRIALRGRSVTSNLRWLLLFGFIALTGVIYMMVFDVEGAFFIGAIYALACSLPLIAYETGNLSKTLVERVRRLSTPRYFLSSLAIYFVLSGIGFAAAGTLMKITGLAEASWWNLLILRPKPFLYTLAFFLSGITILRVRQLLGRQVFMSLLTGRYRHPIEEERVFMFIDVVGSTAFARQHGDLRAQEYLSEVFASFAPHVRRHGGEIDDYVGDCAIVTWPMKEGVEPARCVNCLFDILDDIEKDATWWIKSFGCVPKLSAALHGGSIVTAEIGVFHHKISYFGDVVNTTARIEGLCKSLKQPLLISQDLLARLSLPPDVEAIPAGAHLVKGRDEPIGVLSLRRKTMRQS